MNLRSPIGEERNVEPLVTPFEDASGDRRRSETVVQSIEGRLDRRLDRDVAEGEPDLAIRPHLGS